MNGDVILWGWVVSFALLFLTGSSVVAFLLFLALFALFSVLLLRHANAANQALDKFNNWIDKHFV